MEQIRTVLDDHDEYARLVHGGAAQASPVTVCSKSGAMQSGAPGIVVAFEVEVDGRVVPVQATTSLRCFLSAADLLRARHEASL